MGDNKQVDGATERGFHIPIIRGRLLARNTGLNLLGHVLPAVSAIVLIPPIVRGFGVDRFGVLSLALVVLGYMSIFDLGLGRATIRFVAEALGRDEPERLPGIVWTSLAVQFAQGVVGGAALMALAPFLVSRALRVPPSLQGETQMVLYLLAAAIPVLICTASLKGVLEAHQRFGIVNIVKAVAGSALFGAPALGVALGMRLTGVMVLLDAALLATGIAYLMLTLWFVPQLRAKLAFDPATLGRLFQYGGWVMVSTLTIPVLVYSDRILLAALTSVALLAFYTVPYELVSRLQVIPGSLATVLFPAFTTLSAGGRERLGAVYARSLHYLLLVMAPLAVGLVVSAHLLLQVWLGPTFADRGAIVLQLIAIGVLLNSLAQVPAHLLDAINRPDLKAKLFLSYLVPYLALTWLLIAHWGIAGAALAWLIRAGLELVLFFAVAHRLLRLDRGVFLNGWFAQASVTFALFVIVGLALGAAVDSRIGNSIALMASFGVLFVFVIWVRILDEFDRRLFVKLVGKVAGRVLRAV